MQGVELLLLLQGVEMDMTCKHACGPQNCGDEIDEIFAVCAWRRRRFVFVFAPTTHTELPRRALRHWLQ